MTEPTNIAAETQTGEAIDNAAPVFEDGVTPADTKETEQKTPGKRGTFVASLALTLVVLALLASAWQWLNTRHRFTQLEQVLTQRLQQYGDTSQQTRALSDRADERTIESSARIAQLEQKLDESRDQQESLQLLYQELANNREERTIGEVEQLMIIANQQLLLAGNVRTALLALQTADSRLQQIDAPQIIQLRKAVSQDIQRLQNLPQIDTLGINLKLEGLVASVDSLPLVSERHPMSEAQAIEIAESNQWRRLVNEMWQDLKGMIRLERIDRPEPPLLAPDQSFFLRENIKLHLLTARIALLQRDETSYRSDLAATEQALKNHFDVREPATRNALATINQLSANNIVIQVPDINDSLALVSKYKLSMERTIGAGRSK